MTHTTTKPEEKKPMHAKPQIYARYFELLKPVAEKYGYNLLIHGSMNRDLDLVAVQWRRWRGEYRKMVEEFASVLGGTINRGSGNEPPDFQFGRHQINRITCAINMERSNEHNNYTDPQYYIDISIIF